MPATPSPALEIAVQFTHHTLSPERAEGTAVLAQFRTSSTAGARP